MGDKVESFTDDTEYYNITGFGIDERLICHDDEDCKIFLTQLEKSLLFNNDSVGIVAYCLESGSFSILASQNKSDGRGVARLLHTLTTQYNKLFCEKYAAEDVLSEGDYTIKKIDAGQIPDISRKFHTCHSNWIDYSHSSLRAYLYDEAPVWLDKKPITSVYKSAVEYFDYLSS